MTYGQGHSDERNAGEYAQDPGICSHRFDPKLQENGQIRRRVLGVFASHVDREAHFWTISVRKIDLTFLQVDLTFVSKIPVPFRQRPPANHQPSQAKVHPQFPAEKGTDFVFFRIVPPIQQDFRPFSGSDVEPKFRVSSAEKIGHETFFWPNFVRTRIERIRQYAGVLACGT